MSSTADGYRDGVALWAAATDRAKTEAVSRGANSGALLRQFVNDRFLARVFNVPNAPWVLKGGTAVLARVADARTTKDVDLLGELDDIDVALERLRSAAAVDLGDHFRFIITGHDRTVVGTGQPHVDGYRVHVGLTCTNDGPVVAGDDEPEVGAEVDRGCGSQAPQGDVDVVELSEEAD